MSHTSSQRQRTDLGIRHSEHLRRTHDLLEQPNAYPQYFQRATPWRTLLPEHFSPKRRRSCSRVVTREQRHPRVFPGRQEAHQRSRSSVSYSIITTSFRLYLRRSSLILSSILFKDTMAPEGDSFLISTTRRSTSLASSMALPASHQYQSRDEAQRQIGSNAVDAIVLNRNQLPEGLEGR
jgi:hypothetical protein